MKASFISILLINLIALCASIEDKEVSYYYKDYIKSLGYKLEEYEVITEDYYKLSLWHFVPNFKVDPNKVVYFQPGFMCVAWVFLQNGKKSLPFLLMEEGYDVWIGHNRGTVHSLGHLTKDSQASNSDYWDFNLDDYALKDLPANLETVKQKTGAKKLNYIGHSQGTTIFFMLYMHNPSYMESTIDKFVSLGTVYTINYASLLPVNVVDKMYGLLDMIMDLSTKPIYFGEGQRNMIANICKRSPFFCKKTFESMENLRSTSRINFDTINTYFYYFPGGTSANCLLHYSQIHQSKKLVYFNPDFAKNKEVKEYNINVIKKWKIKSFIDRSDCDAYSSYQDVTELYDTIEDKSYINLVDYKEYGHMDFVCGETAPEDVYIPVINFIKE